KKYQISGKKNPARGGVPFHSTVNQPGLFESVGVVEDQTSLVSVGRACQVSIAAVGTVTQRGAETLERTALDDVVNTHVAFPLVELTACSGANAFDVFSVQVSNCGFQAWDAQTCEVIGVLTEGSVFTGTGEVTNHGVSEQVNAGTAVTFVAVATVNNVTLTQENHAAVIADLLMADQECVATQGVGEHRGPGLVINYASFLGIAAVVVEDIAGLAILAVVAAVEVTQVSLEGLVFSDWQDVYQTQEMLLVVVFQVRVVVLQGQVFGDFPVAASETELVAAFS